MEIAKQIAGEVTEIWGRASVPMTEANNCTNRVFEVITKFKTWHNLNEMKKYAKEMV